MYYPHILKTTHKVNLCVAFFPLKWEKNLSNGFHGSILYQYIYNHISMDSSGSSKCFKTFFNWIWAKNIFTNFLKPQLFDVALWMFYDFFLPEIVESIRTFDFEREPWKKVSFNKYLKEALRKILSIIYSMCLNF